MPQTVDVLLENNDLSIQDLSERSGLSVERIDAIVNGRWTPSPEERLKIAMALELTVDDISWGHTINPRNVRYHRYGLPEDLHSPKDGRS